VRLAKRAARLVESEDYQEAIDLLRRIISDNISEVDKSMMCLNVAFIYKKMGEPELALGWYDAGVDYERDHGRSFVAEKKAAYLAKQGRHQESLEHYEELLTRPHLTKGDRARIKRNIEILKGRAE
jgi:tetratricopeptide (TPR) repeat protein